MCDVSFPSVGLRDVFAPQHVSSSIRSTDKVSDSSSLPSEGIEQTDEDYLNSRWSHTAKCLRDFTQRKAAQAEEIRRHRASLQFVCPEEHATALAAADEPRQPTIEFLGRSALEALDNKPPWQDPLLEQAASNAAGAPKLRPSTTMRTGFLQATPSGGCSTSISNLDIMLQSVLQRSTAVSTKLTKTYAQGSSNAPEEPVPEPPQRSSLSHVSLRRMASHARLDRSRNQSRIQRQNTQKDYHHHDDAGSQRETQPALHASPPPSQQQHSRPNVSSYGSMGLSPTVSRSSSPGSLGMRESLRSSLPHVPSTSRTPSPSRLETCTGSGDLPARFRDYKQMSLRSASPPSRQEVPGPNEPPPQQQQQPQPQQQPQEHQLARSGLHEKCGSSNGYKPKPAPRRNLLGRRALSHSMDGITARGRRRSDGPYIGACDGPPADRGLRTAGSDNQPRRQMSGAGVRLPLLSHGAPRSAAPGATDKGEGRGTAGRGGVPKQGNSLASSGSSRSNGGELSALRSGSGSRRRSVKTQEQQQQQHYGSSLYGLASFPSGGQSPYGLSSWAKSTTTRDLVFVHF